MEWSDDELVASWTLVGEDWPLVGNKTGATRLGFAVLLKFFEIEARFPRAAEEVPPSAVAYVAEQLAVDAGEFVTYGWSGRTIEYHRAQVRAAFGFREFARGDEDKLAGWLAEEVCPVELRDEQLREAWNRSCNRGVSEGIDVWLGLCCVRRFSKKMWRGCRDQPGGSVPGPDAATVAAPHQGDPA